MNKNKKKILRSLSALLSFINKLIPKKDNKIVIYSNMGFRDNVRAIYDYLIENDFNEKYEIICAINNYKSYKNQIDTKNVRVVNCWIGVYYFFVSKYFFYSFGKYPIKPSTKQIVVNLWHGMPLKRIGKLAENERSEDQNYFTYVIATSEFFKKIMKEVWACEKEQVLIVGQPRNDDLFKKIDLKRIFKIDYDNKIICYMPTFRKSNYLDIDNSSSEIQLYDLLKQNETLFELNETLRKLKLTLVVKPHPLDDFDISFIKKLSNVLYIDENDFNDNKINLYKVLGSTDALITDYSSVYFDYLLIDKPIGFIVDDIGNYDTKRGFVLDAPLSIMPGKKIINMDELIDFFKEISLGIDAYFEERNKVNELCNYYKDDKGAERVLNKIGISKK